MGIILPESKENEILKLLRQDDVRHLQEYIERNQLPRDLLYTNHKRTLIQLSCYYESPRCLAKLIEMNHDYNQIETSTGDTPLFICSKFNNLEMVKTLLEKSDIKNLVKNYENLNEFDIAFLKGNYCICYYLMYVYKNKNNGMDNIYNDNEDKNDIKNEKNNNDIVYINKNKGKKDKNEINESSSNSSASTYDINQVYQKYFYNTDFEYDYFLTLQAQNKYPLFNMPLFFKCLCNKTLPSECPSFAAPHKKTEDLLTKIPDPNETWGHFFKRVATMDLYNPPLVDKKNVSVMNSMYMNTQMKLMENEYGIKMGFYKRDNENINDDETKHPLDMEESDIIQVQKKGKQNKVKERNNIDNENNEIKEKEKEIKYDDINNDDIENDNDNENNIDNVDRDNEGNLCIIKIDENFSSQRNVKEENKNE